MKKRYLKAQSIVEFMVLIVILTGVMTVMQKTVLKAFMGRMKTAGETLGYGRQYDKNKTTACLLCVCGETEVWLKESCVFDNKGTAFADKCGEACSKCSHSECE